MRPAELLAIQGVYPTAAEAREALDGVGKHMAIALAEKSLERQGPGAARAAHALRGAAGRRRRAAGRLIPLIGAPIGAVQNGNATAEVGRRALRFYGGDRPAATQARP